MSAVGSNTKIGVLALQGCVREHFPHIESLGAKGHAVKSIEDAKQVDALIIPGGESTTITKLLKNFDLFNYLKNDFHSRAMWGICAGSIVMSKKITGRDQDSLSLLDIEVERNSFGTQKESHEDLLNGYPVCFIRAPKILWAAKEVEILAHHRGAISWVKQGNKMATTFHCELTEIFPSPWHKQFIDLI